MGARGIHPARLELTSDERATLERWTRRRSTAQTLALRARIVLACADRPDVAHGQLAEELGVHPATAGTCARASRCGGSRGSRTIRASGPRAGSATPTSSARSPRRSSRRRRTPRTGIRAGWRRPSG